MNGSTFILIVGTVAIISLMGFAAITIGNHVDEQMQQSAFEHNQSDYLKGYLDGLDDCHDYLIDGSYTYYWDTWHWYGSDNRVGQELEGYNAGKSKCEEVKKLERDLYVACRFRTPDTSEGLNWTQTCRGTTYYTLDKEPTFANIRSSTWDWEYL